MVRRPGGHVQVPRSSLQVHSRSLVIVSLLSSGAGCKAAPDKGDGHSGVATSAVMASGAPSTEIAAPQPSVPALMDIPGRFQYEAAHRPRGALTGEQFFDVVTAAGEVLTERKQHLANPFGAQFCQGAKAEREQHYYSVCEFMNEADAEAGIASAEKFGTARRKAIRNGSSLLIARYDGTSDTSKAERIFRSLKPLPPAP